MANSYRITLYIGTYTRRESFVDGKAEGIYIYTPGSGSGELTYAATVAGAGTVNPSFLTLGRTKAVCMLLTRSGDGKVSAFTIHPVTGGSELSKPTIDPWPVSLLCQH